VATNIASCVRVCTCRLARYRDHANAVPENGTVVRSDDANVLRFVALLAPADIEFDAVALVQGLVPFADDVGEVDEDIVTLGTGNEAVALLRVEELHRTLCHNCSFHVTAGQRVRLACSQ
jgi:hypothetical protein